MKRFALLVILGLFVGVNVQAQTNEPLRIGSHFLASGLDPSSLDPTKGSNGWALVSYGVGENLFTIDKEGLLRSELAQDARRESEFVWLVTLQADRYFSDGSPLTAAAVAAGFDNTMANAPIAQSTGGVLSFEAIDDLTLKVTTQKPVPLLQSLFAEWPMIVYKLNHKGEAIYTGPYKVADFKADSHLELHPNMYFPGADKRSAVLIRRFGDGQAMAMAFEAGDLDMAFRLPFELVGRLGNDPNLIVKSFPVAYQYMAFLNTQRAPLDDVRVRQAIDLTIDGEELVAALGGGHVATGAYAPYFPFAGKTPRPTDLERAGILLDEAGWRRGESGMREKDGQNLQLHIATYTSSDLVAMLPVVRAQLTRLGIVVTSQIFENIPQMAITEEINIALRAQNTAPSGDPSFVMESMFRSGAALNHAHYSSFEFDAIIDQFATTGDLGLRNEIAMKAQEKLFEDAPVAFLVSPVWYVGLSERLENYQPWGSDYHILRADIGEK